MTRTPQARQLVEADEAVIALRFGPQWGSELERFIRGHSQRLWPKLKKLLPPGQRTAAGDEGCRLVQVAMSLTEQWVARQAKKHSPLHWLWLLRRTPSVVFAGSLTTSAGYDALLAEVLSNHAVKVRPAWSSSQSILRYPISASILDDLSQHCCAARYLSDLHRTYRRVAKGAVVTFHPVAPPAALCDEALDRAIDLYDSRFENIQSLGDRLGIADTRSLTEHLQRPLGTDALAGLMPVRPIWLNADDIAEELGEAYALMPPNVDLQVRFMPSPLSASRSIAILGALSRRQLAVACLLQAAWLYISEHVARMHSLLTRGYLLFEQPTLRRCTTRALEALQQDGLQLGKLEDLADAGALIRFLSNDPGSCWPLGAGPCIRLDGESACVDLYATTRRFLAMEASTDGGAPANMRARSFELAAQSLIDSSEWRPTPSLGAIRGRTLRRKGTAITDIDALGARGRTLLLVSCKSRVYSGQLDAGEYRAVRNASDAVCAAVDAWNQVLNTLRTSRTGDNFDFGGFTSIIGLVCTPLPIWTPLGPATQEVASGLTAVCCAEELRNWLAKPP